jgi:hypothetical protein
MCKAPKPPAKKEPKKPQFLRNRYLDEFVGEASAVKSLKTGRASLRIPLESPSGVGGRDPAQSLAPASKTPTSNAPTVIARPRPVAERPRLVR